MLALYSTLLVLAWASVSPVAEAPATAAPAPSNAPAPASPIPPVTAPPRAAALSLPATSAVAAFYEARSKAPIWFREPGDLQAAMKLVELLRRGALDGLSEGPRLAAELESALAQSQAAPAANRHVHERLFSSAWVAYVAALHAPARGMTYGDPALAPKMPSTERILADAAKASSLLKHVETISSVNPLYAQLREAAWQQMQLAGGTAALDPRLLSNLERARVLPSSGRFILVDAATARLWTYEDGEVRDTMKVVVGKRSSPTPLIAGTIHYATLNPYWNIPSDVVRRVVAPLVVKRGTAYLKLAEYEVASDYTEEAKVVPPDEVDWQAVAAGKTEVRIRQLPGPNNMMGKIKFGFINDLGIYLHDTPEKRLFAKDKRNFSLGCVRVEDAQRLARWLLGREAVAPSDGPEQHVKLDKGVPVFITYLTAYAQDGQLSFTEDVYGLDPKPDSGLAAAPAAPAADTSGGR